MVGRAYNPALYRFGINSQEKDNEVSGVGNSMAATFWEYDSRLGRRWNIDPKASPSESNYLVFRGDPILLSDIHGDTPGPNDKKDGVGYFFAKQIYLFFKSIEYIFRSFGLTDKKLDEARNSEKYKTDGKYRAQVDLESFHSGLETLIKLEVAGRILDNVVNLASAKIEKIDLPKGLLNEESEVFTAVKAGHLPGSQGAFLGEKRMTDAMIRDLSEQYGREFAQLYTAGTGKNGAGGFYTLYSGTGNSLQVPTQGENGEAVYLINHTHPGGTITPSKADIKYLKDAQSAGSKIKSSVILPKGKPAVRFNTSSPTSK